MKTRTNCIKTWLPLLAAAVLSLPAAASDIEREKRWAEQIEDVIFTGEMVMLDAGGQEFLSIYTEAASEPAQGGVILLHGIGVHPNWTDVIYPLRVQLPEHGWATLSLQMPILAADAEIADYYPIFDEVPPRIEAGVRYLQSQGIDNIVIAGHSLGSQMAAYWLAQQESAPVTGLVAIGLAGTRRSADGDVLAWIGEIDVPVLDLYGEEDLPAIRDTVAARAEAAAGGGNSNYTQQAVAGAGHMFQGRNDALLEAVVVWLGENAAPSTD